MVKKHVMISIDDSIHEKAQKKGVNVSAISERAVRNELDDVSFSESDGTHCEWCSKELERATRDTEGLMWLWPDEKWICPNCLTKLCRRIPVIPRKPITIDFGHTIRTSRIERRSLSLRDFPDLSKHF